MATESLRGNRFITDSYLFEGKLQTHRTCGMCAHRDKAGQGDCKEDEAKRCFKIPETEELPKVLDGVPVAPYCPYYMDFGYDWFE